jgi:hypothetical protein
LKFFDFLNISRKFRVFESKLPGHNWEIKFKNISLMDKGIFSPVQASK